MTAHPAYSEAGLRFLVDEQQSLGAKWAQDEIARLRDALEPNAEPSGPESEA